VTPSSRADAFDGAPAALCEAYRVLRPDGLLAVSAPRTRLTDRALAA
jgi:ubiquinone/menaquinone biosynthesis C-methylase UbiE